MSIFADRLVNIAYNEIGEEEATANTSPRIIRYMLTTTLPPGKWAWCAAFTSWCLRWVLEDPRVQHELIQAGHIRSYSDIEDWRCKSPRAFSWETWAQSKRIKIIYNGEGLAKKGDFVVYDFSHMGIVASDQARPNQMLNTIEGNTSVQGSREGDGVYAKSRKPHSSIISSYIRVIP